MMCLGDSKDLNLFGGSMRKEEKIIWEKGGSEMVLIPAGSAVGAYGGTERLLYG